MAVLIKRLEVVNFHNTIKPTHVVRFLAAHLLKSRAVPKQCYTALRVFYVLQLNVVFKG